MKSTAATAIFIFSLLLLSTNSLTAQESDEYKKLKYDAKYREGFILNKDSSKVTGLIKGRLMNESSLYSQVEFIHQDGSKKKYKPKDIKGFSTLIDNYISDGESFYKVIRTGRKVNLYYKVTKSTHTSFGGPGGATTTSYNYESENYYVRKPSETNLKLVRKKSFANEFSDYFSNCEKLKAKIVSKQLTHKDIESIVNEYNYCK